MRKIFSPLEHEAILKSSGANAVEFHPNEPERLAALLSCKAFDDFRYLSVHLPGNVKEYPVESQIAVAKQIMDVYPIKNAVLHPVNLPEEHYKKLVEAGIPVSIENMDRNNSSGYLFSELETLLVSHNLKFVLDVQHAYEHDSSMKYAREIFEMGKERLVEFHVSGESETYHHSLLYKATNTDAILDFLGSILGIKSNVPIILEGEYASKEELKKEIDFLKKSFGLKIKLLSALFLD